MPISQSIAIIWIQIIHASRLLRERAVRRDALAGFIVLIAAILLAPSDDIIGWDWLRLLLMGVLAMLSILTMSASRHLRIRLETRRARIIGASILFVLALIVGLTFGPGSAAIFSFGFSLIAIQAFNLRREPWMLIGLFVLLIPFWVWTALGAWSGGLLLLLPIAALALIGDEHMRQASSPEPEPSDPLSWRAHRLAAWIAILLAAALTLIVALTTSIPDTWVAIGAIGAIGFIALEIGYPRADDAPREYSVLFTELAFVWIVFCWMVSL